MIMIPVLIIMILIIILPRSVVSSINYMLRTVPFQRS